MSTALPTASLHERVLAALDAEVAETALPAWQTNICRRLGLPERAVAAAIDDLARAVVVRRLQAGIWGMTDVARVPADWQTPGTLDHRIVAAVGNIAARTGWGASFTSIAYRLCIRDPELLHARLADLVADGVLMHVDFGWRLAREH